MNKIILSSMLLLAVVASWGVAYAMWFGELRVNTMINMGSGELDITSTKLLCSYDHECCDNCCNDSSRDHGHDHDHSHCSYECGVIEVSDDGETAYIHVLDAMPGSDIWIGLVLSNDGSLPVSLANIRIYVNGTEETGEYYVYGPYRAPGTSGVWGHVDIDDLPFPGYISLPSTPCNPSEKLIAWIHVVAPETPGTTVEYTIVINSFIAP